MTTTQAAKYQPGDEASIKFQGMEQAATIVGGPVLRHTERGYPGDRTYFEYTISLDEMDDGTTVEAAESELF